MITFLKKWNSDWDHESTCCSCNVLPEFVHPFIRLRWLCISTPRRQQMLKCNYLYLQLTSTLIKSKLSSFKGVHSQSLAISYPCAKICSPSSLKPLKGGTLVSLFSSFVSIAGVIGHALILSLRKGIVDLRSPARREWRSL